jgi:hypothetical protein
MPDSPNLKGQVAVFISLRISQIIPQATCDSQAQNQFRTRCNSQHLSNKDTELSLTVTVNSGGSENTSNFWWYQCVCIGAHCQTHGIQSSQESPGQGNVVKLLEDSTSSPLGLTYNHEYMKVKNRCSRCRISYDWQVNIIRNRSMHRKASPVREHVPFRVQNQQAKPEARGAQCSWKSSKGHKECDRLQVGPRMRVYSRIWRDKPTLYSKFSYDRKKTHCAHVMPTTMRRRLYHTN